MKKLLAAVLAVLTMSVLFAVSTNSADASTCPQGLQFDTPVTCIDGIWYEYSQREIEYRCVAPYSMQEHPHPVHKEQVCIFLPHGRASISGNSLRDLYFQGKDAGQGNAKCPASSGIPADAVYGEGGQGIADWPGQAWGATRWNELAPNNTLRWVRDPANTSPLRYFVWCTQGAYSNSDGVGKLFWKQCPAGTEVHVIPGISKPPFARTVGDRHLCIKRATPRFVTPTPDAGSGTPPGSATPTPVPTAVPTPVGGVGGGCGKFKPGVDLCSTSKAEWTTCEGDWKVTVGDDANQDALADVFAGSGLIDSVEVPGLPVGQDFTAYLWIKPVNGANFTMSDRKAFTCSASGAPTPVPTVAAPVVPPAPYVPIATPTPDPGLVYPGPFESFFVDNLKEVIFPFGFGAFGPGSAPTGATSSGAAEPDVVEPGADVPEAEPAADAEPTVTPKPVAAGAVVVPGLGQKLCAGDTFRFRGGSGQWKVTVGAAADVDKYMHVDVGAVGAASNGELKISGVPAGSKPRVIVWNRAPGEKAYGAVSVTPYVCPK